MITKVKLFENQTLDTTSEPIEWAGGIPSIFVSGDPGGATLQMTATIEGETEGIGDAMAETGLHNLDSRVQAGTVLEIGITGATGTTNVSVVLMSV